MKEIVVEFEKHKSAKSICLAYARFDHPRMKEENLLKHKVGLEFKFDDGQYHIGTVNDLIKVVRKLGMWGFCDKITNSEENPIIHFWVGSKAKKDKNKVMELFGHEVGHAIGYSSENMAIKFGAVTGLAFLAMNEEVYGGNL